MHFALLKKAPSSGAFLLSGVLLSFFLSLLPAFPAWAQSCKPFGAAEIVQVRKVFDGDTVLLSDGRRVRLLGIDTPELGRDGRVDQPGAVAAKRQLERLIGGQPLRLIQGLKRHDRYGRVLGHLYLPDGRHLTAELLRKGAGFWISVAPNVRLAECFARAELQAQHAESGLWAGYRWQRAGGLQAGAGGFHLLTGQVTRVDRSRRAVWVELDDRLVVQITDTLAKQIGYARINRWLGTSVRVRGWVIDRQARGQRLKKGYKRWLIRLSAVTMLQPATD